MTHRDLLDALAELNLPHQATLKDIRSRHRQLVKKYHPDHGAAPDNDRIRRINAAYRLVSAYISDYLFDFSKEKFMEQYPEERLREQFYDADLWGAKDERPVR